MNTSNTYQSLIGGLCPPHVIIVAGRGARAGDLLPEEEAAVAGALETRRVEFSQGRSYAREALRRLGAQPGPILVRSDRAPIWPTGVVGTITHTRGFVCAAVAWQSDVAALGVDVESRNRPLADNLTRFVETPDERQARLPKELDPLRLVFSAKESVHKCISPISGITLGFLDVELDFEVVSGQFRARLLREHVELPNFDEIIGRFAVTRRFVITTAAIRGAGHTAPVLPIIHGESQDPNSHG